MKFLDYIKSAGRYKTFDPKDFQRKASITIVSNFTDDILSTIFTGVCLYNNVYPSIYKVPYKQYHLDLRDPASELYTKKSDFTFIFFDINPFKKSEFHESQRHFDEIFRDIEKYARIAGGTVIINSIIVSYQTAYGNLFKESPQFKLIEDYNKKLDEMAMRVPNLLVFDTNRLVHLIGELHTFDARGLYAFDIPFTHEFIVAIAEGWFASLRAHEGGSKKCIVLDLDNTLWGGVVGELGQSAIALGPDYPGNAFMNFQHALLDFYNRGIILAIASKNNFADVLAVFRENPNMVLKENHFSIIKANWDEKADSIIMIAKELNIGTESMVFIDDDPVSRERIKVSLPEVSVPEFSLAPEEYVKTLYGLDLFDQASLTDEDKQKGKMYAEEGQRKQIGNAARDIDAYIKELGIKAAINVNDYSLVPRLAQLTKKTNQFNLTTRRYNEHDIERFMAGGDLVFSAHVIDRFGDYGIVVEAIVAFPRDSTNAYNNKEATLDTFLMSCRVMGRGVECAFMDHVIRELHMRGIAKLCASFISTAKNEPIKQFLPEHGFLKEGDAYLLNIVDYIKKPCSKLNKNIIITQ